MPDYVLGKGKVYIDKYENGVKTGERYLGNCPGFEVSVTSEKLPHYASTGGLREKDEEVTIEVSRAGSITVDDISLENMSLFLIGDVDVKSQTSGSVTDESHTVLQGRFYQLGASASNPTGVRGLSNVAVTDSGSVTTYTEGTDYNVDLTLGRLEIIEGGAIASGSSEDILVSYDTDANSRDRVITNSAGSIDVALRYIADNPKGTNRDLYGPKVTMTPSGSFAFIGEEWLQMQFDLEFLKTDAEAALYVDGRAA